MQESGNPSPLRAVEMTARGVQVRYSSGKGHKATYDPPRFFRIGLEEVFIPWPDAPSEIKEVTLEWQGSPFMTEAFFANCKVLKQGKEGLTLTFNSPLPSAFTNWFASVSGLLFREAPDAAIRTSQLYTMATVVSACGLFCGATAILLPIVVGDQSWVDTTAKVFLVIMVASIGAFALIRLLAGRQEVRAIGQGKS